MLKPCPFCGIIPELDPDYYGDFSIFCRNEECHVMVDVLEPTENQAIEAWNRRTPPHEATNERIAIDATRPGVTCRAIVVEPGEKAGVFLEAGGVKMEINPNPVTWEEIKSKKSLFHDLLFVKRLSDVDELTRKPWAK